MPIPSGGGAVPVTMTVADIGLRVKRQFGDESGGQITDADILRWVNDAQRELALSNQLLQIKANSNLIAGNTEYGVPDNILTMHSVKFNGRKLQGISLQEADELIDSNSGATGSPSHYWMWAGGINFYPTPDVGAVALGQLTIYYTRQPVVVTLQTDVPELPAQYHNRIVEYCLAQAYELDDNAQSAQMKMQQFQQGSDKLKDNESWMQRDVYPSITVSADDTQAEGMRYYAW